MNITTRLSLAGTVSGVVVAAIVGVVTWTTWNVRSQMAKNEAAEEVLNAATGIRYLTFDYALHHEVRAEVQWHRRHSSLSALLDRTQAAFDLGDADVLKRLRETNGTVASLFQELVASRGQRHDASEQTADEEFEESVTSQIVVRLETMIGDALGLSQRSRTGLLAAQRQAMITVVTLGIVILVVMTVATLLVRRSVSEPLGALQAGTAIIGGGDLGYRLAATGGDEIGNLARAFNTMAENLQKDRAGRMAAQADLERTRSELAHVARVATLGELTAAIAHEVNQPLGAIVNNANASLRWLAAVNLEAARASATQIVADGHRASEILARIRQMVRKTTPQKQPFDINDAIRDVVILTSSQAESCGSSISYKLCDHPPLVLGDRVQIQQVVLNLLVNAFEAMGAAPANLHGIEIVSKWVAPDTLQVSVCDSAGGIDGIRVDHLFDAFYTTKTDGLGMGLAICRAIIEDHGGRIWATPNQETGATFHFTIPVAGEKRA